MPKDSHADDGVIELITHRIDFIAQQIRFDRTRAETALFRFNKDGSMDVSSPEWFLANPDRSEPRSLPGVEQSEQISEPMLKVIQWPVGETFSVNVLQLLEHAKKLAEVRKVALGDVWFTAQLPFKFHT